MSSYLLSVLSLSSLLLIGCGSGGSSSSTISSSSLSSSSSSIAPQAPIEAEVHIKIDTKTSLGKYKSFLGVNKPPVSVGIHDASNLTDGRELYRFIGINEVRMHDSFLDICKIFTADKVIDKNTNSEMRCRYDGDDAPWVYWSAEGSVDADANYDFEEADQFVSYIQDINASLYLRLGDSYHGVNEVENINDYAKVAKKIFQHYDGTVPISAIEIHNEADGIFWKGSTKDFYDFNNLVINYIQTAQMSDYKLGGNGFTHNVVKKLIRGDSFINDWFSNVETDKLDFYSAHYYGECENTSLQHYQEWISTLRQELDQHGFNTKPIHVTEWNIGLGQICGSTTYTMPRNFTFDLGVLFLSQETKLNIEKMHFYSGIGNPMALISVDERQNTLSVNPAYWSFYISKVLQEGTRLDTQVCYEDSTCISMPDAVANQSLFSMTIQKENRIEVVILNDSNSSSSYEILDMADANGIIEVRSFEPQKSHTISLSKVADFLVPPQGALVDLLNTVMSASSLHVRSQRVANTIAPYSVQILTFKN